MLSFLQQYPEGIALKNIIKVGVLKNVSSVLKKLHSTGLLQIEEKQTNNFLRKAKQLLPWIKAKSPKPN